MADAKQSARRTAVDGTNRTFTAEERAAMRERARELKSASRSGASPADGEAEILAKIAEMPPADRAIAERIHALIRENAPGLEPRTWYGMPAYAKDGTVVCHFQPAQKFKTRYASFAFTDKAAIDDGTMWPIAWALATLTPANEARLVTLVRKAVG